MFIYESLFVIIALILFFNCLIFLTAMDSVLYVSESLSKYTYGGSCAL